MEAESREIPTGTTGLYKDTVTSLYSHLGGTQEWGAVRSGGRRLQVLERQMEQAACHGFPVSLLAGFP